MSKKQKSRQQQQAPKGHRYERDETVQTEEQPQIEQVTTEAVQSDSAAEPMVNVEPRVDEVPANAVVAPETAATGTDDTETLHHEAGNTATSIQAESTASVPKKLSCIEAAYQVLLARTDPMSCPELIDVMATEGIWSSPKGKTPANTLYASILREIKLKEGKARFRRIGSGKFIANPPEAG